MKFAAGTATCLTRTPEGTLALAGAGRWTASWCVGPAGSLTNTAISRRIISICFRREDPFASFGDPRGFTRLMRNKSLFLLLTPLFLHHLTSRPSSVPILYDIIQS